MAADPTGRPPLAPLVGVVPGETGGFLAPAPLYPTRSFSSTTAGLPAKSPRSFMVRTRPKYAGRQSRGAQLAATTVGMLRLKPMLAPLSAATAARSVKGRTPHAASAALKWQRPKPRP